MPLPRFVHTRRASGLLPPVRFGTLVGVFQQATLVPEGRTRPDDNHLYLWLQVPIGPVAGLYECAFNIHATNAHDVLFTDWLEDRTGQPLPVFGFAPAALSYAALGLHDRDFAPVRSGDLQSLVTHYAASCDRIAVYGTTYSQGTGLHDIHFNSGEPPESRHRSRHEQDGVLVFYFEGAYSYARWIFIRFAEQHLGAA